MKKMVAFLFGLICIFVFIGCNTQEKIQGSDTTTEHSTTSNTIIPSTLLTCYMGGHVSGSTSNLIMSQEQAEFIMAVWNDALWEPDITKTVYGYVFRGDNIEVRYCYDKGLFNDVINNRHVFLTQDVKEQVNQEIDKFVIMSIVG